MLAASFYFSIFNSIAASTPLTFMMKVPKTSKRIKILKEDLIICVSQLSTPKITNIWDTKKFKDKKLPKERIKPGKYTWMKDNGILSRNNHWSNFLPTSSLDWMLEPCGKEYFLCRLWARNKVDPMQEWGFSQPRGHGSHKEQHDCSR